SWTLRAAARAAPAANGVVGAPARPHPYGIGTRSLPLGAEVTSVLQTHHRLEPFHAPTAGPPLGAPFIRGKRLAASDGDDHGPQGSADGGRGCLTDGSRQGLHEVLGGVAVEVEALAAARGRCPGGRVVVDEDSNHQIVGLAGADRGCAGCGPAPR